MSVTDVEAVGREQRADEVVLGSAGRADPVRALRAERRKGGGKGAAGAVRAAGPYPGCAEPGRRPVGVQEVHAVGTEEVAPLEEHRGTELDQSIELAEHVVLVGRRSWQP